MRARCCLCQTIRLTIPVSMARSSVRSLSFKSCFLTNKFVFQSDILAFARLDAEVGNEGLKRFNSLHSCVKFVPFHNDISAIFSVLTRRNSARFWRDCLDSIWRVHRRTISSPFSSAHVRFCLESSHSCLQARQRKIFPLLAQSLSSFSAPTK